MKRRPVDLGDSTLGIDLPDASSGVCEVDMASSIDSDARSGMREQWLERQAREDQGEDAAAMEPSHERNYLMIRRLGFGLATSSAGALTQPSSIK